MCQPYIYSILPYSVIVRYSSESNKKIYWDGNASFKYFVRDVQG